MGQGTPGMGVSSTKNKAALEMECLQRAVGVLSGLQKRMYAPVPYQVSPGLDSSPVRYAQCSCQTHCYRSVSQRTLSVPRRFCVSIDVGASVDLIAPIMTALGIVAGNLTAPGTGPIFYDANNGIERQQIEDLVWIATRTYCCTNVVQTVPPDPGGGVGDVASLTDWDGLNAALCCYILAQVGISWFWSSDRRSPIVDFTNLGYFSRPTGEFVPQPATQWTDRDQAAFLLANNSFNDQANLCSLNGPPVPSHVDLMIVIEGLWITNPYVCGDDWPGSLCGPSKVIGANQGKGYWRA